MLKTLHPKFEPPKLPFLRMSYRDAIKYLNEHGIKRKDDDTGEMVDHVVGDDIAEAAERQMTDQLGVPMFLHGFPKHLKAFYMKKIPGDEEFTESCDLLMPNVGEIVGKCQSSGRRNIFIVYAAKMWILL
jgi:asparaginyl-tRNA synthetase